MPAPVHNPAAQAPPHMAHTPDPQPPEPTPAAAAATARPRIRDQIAENPLASLLGAVIIVMLGFTLTTSYDRFVRLDDRITRLDDRITRLEDKIDARFEQVDARFEQIDARFAAQDQKIDARFAAQDQEIDTRFDSLESDVAEINLKLTALIAALNATGAVDAALEGRLAGTDTADATDEPR